MVRCPPAHVFRRCAHNGPCSREQGCDRRCRRHTAVVGCAVVAGRWRPDGRSERAVEFELEWCAAPPIHVLRRCADSGPCSREQDCDRRGRRHTTVVGCAVVAGRRRPGGRSECAVEFELQWCAAPPPPAHVLRRCAHSGPCAVENKIAIVAAGGIRQLLDALSSPAAGVQEAAANALCNLSTDGAVAAPVLTALHADVWCCRSRLQTGARVGWREGAPGAAVGVCACESATGGGCSRSAPVEHCLRFCVRTVMNRVLRNQRKPGSLTFCAQCYTERRHRNEGHDAARDGTQPITAPVVVCLCVV